MNTRHRCFGLRLRTRAGCRPCACWPPPGRASCQVRLDVCIDSIILNSNIHQFNTKFINFNTNRYQNSRPLPTSTRASCFGAYRSSLHAHEAQCSCPCAEAKQVKEFEHSEKILILAGTGTHRIRYVYKALIFCIKSIIFSKDGSAGGWSLTLLSPPRLEL